MAIQRINLLDIDESPSRESVRIMRNCLQRDKWTCCESFYAWWHRHDHVKTPFAGYEGITKRAKGDATIQRTTASAFAIEV